MTDYTLGDTVNIIFNSRDFSQGIPTALTSGTVAAYESTSTSQITAGITLTATFDSVVGMNLITIVAESSDGYQSGADYHLVLTQGTINAVDATGLVVGRFTIGREGSTKLDDITSATSRLEASTTAIMAGTTALSTKLDDVTSASSRLEATTTAIAATSTAIQAGTTALSTKLDDVTSASSRLEATTTAIQAGTTALSTKLDDVTSATSRLEASTTAIMAGTTMLSTDMDDLIATTTSIAAGTTSLSTDSIADAVWDEVLTGATHNVTNSAGRRLRLLADANVVHAGTAQASTAANTITLSTEASTSDDIYNGDRITIVGGTGAQEHALIIDYDGANLIATVAENWVISPDATSEYELSPAKVDVETVAHATQTAGDLAALITTVDTVVDGIAAGTTALSTDVADLQTTSTAIQAGTTALSTKLDDVTSASSRLEASTTAIMAGTTMLSTDADDLIATTTAIYDIVNNTGAEVSTGHAGDAHGLGYPVVPAHEALEPESDDRIERIRLYLQRCRVADIPSECYEPDNGFVPKGAVQHLNGYRHSKRVPLRAGYLPARWQQRRRLRYRR
jgi:uncharacterized phage infection (PIP) family protein YhgE